MNQRSTGDLGVAGEANLAERIAEERRARGLSVERLAKAMTRAGCKMNGSAIHKIEKGSPPRRINVDELLALAKVFETTVEDLLEPMEVRRNRRAAELLKDYDAAKRTFGTAVESLHRALIAMHQLAFQDDELFAYVVAHSGTGDREAWPVVVYDDDSLDASPINTAMEELHRALFVGAMDSVRHWAEAQMGDED